MSIASLIVVGIFFFTFLTFLVIFAFFIYSYYRWFKQIGKHVRYSSIIKLEDYSCPKCGSNGLELISQRAIRCKKCGTTFTVYPLEPEELVIFPFFWWFPIFLPMSFLLKIVKLKDMVLMK